MNLLSTLVTDAGTLLSGAAKLFGGGDNPSPAVAAVQTAAAAVAPAKSAYDQAVQAGEAAVNTLVTESATTLLNDTLAKFGLGGLDDMIDPDALKFLQQVLAEADALLNAKIGAA